MNLPNKLTVSRLMMAFAFTALMSFDYLACHVVAYFLFIAATITDHYDGKIARARGLVTNFGKLLDPVADKILIVGAFVMLMGVPGLKIPGWTVVVILAREFLITGARSLAASEGTVIAANMWGKTKAVIQMIYVFVFMALAILGQILQMYEHAAAWMPRVLGTYRLVLAQGSMWAIVFVAAFTIYSGIQFMYVNWNTLKLGGRM
jgi:CDP-diacylglycerol--glycerol-3-phosphate 3-phosphatidyltransferase